MRKNLKFDGNVSSNEDIGIYTPPYYIDICRSGNAGLLLGQIKYWWERLGGKEFSMPLHRLASKIGISRREARTAATILKGAGFVKCQSKACGYAPKMTYWIFCEETVASAILQFKAIRNVNATKKMNDWVRAEKSSNSAGPSNGLLSPTDGLYGQSDGPESPIHNNHSNSYLNSSSSPTPSEEKPVAIQERKEEEKIISIMENQNSQGGSPVQPVEAPVKPQAQPLAANDTAIRPSDMKVVAKRMIEDWNVLCPVAKSEANDFMFGLHDRFVDSFNCSFDEWKEYCREIAQSMYLMGERPYKGKLANPLTLAWALSPRTIEKVRNNTYDKDREIPLTVEQREKQVEARKQEIELRHREGILDKIGNSNHPDWVKRFYGKVLGGFGANGYYKVSDNGGSSISQEDGRVQIVTQTLEAEEFIEGRRGEIATFLLSLGMKPNFIVKDVCKLRREKLRALPVEDAKSTRKLGLNPISAILEELRVNEPKRKFANSA